MKKKSITNLNNVINTYMVERKTKHLKSQNTNDHEERNLML